ncbi:bifunctional diaminohydroxyphosphoribosylaminopyrimidine deaminase/5-amino-6-(5-phosphoribosylamino)uracil reductase RibD [Chitinivorax sp. PXF-14]|uniref:bifunctional diaminohydroxyphosphoribosylaminopyrimidine deaminase/5-amino-6-(5-phosphoribosylamino)uracil reductase RibD n=1 Tax=Chitinivorax sp. PXF-14 TaxID=3230488 RepID=UPI0034667C73
MFSITDHQLMMRALRLAERGLFITTPNPRVGCVIAREGQILGEGHTQPAGSDHAEVQALKHCQAQGNSAAGATAYVTLEPCSHFGRTPPCADALLKAGVARVVAAMRDPNPLVAGQGLARLAEAGIAVEVGLLEHEARELNIGFVARMERGRPWLRVKLAASLDGKTALMNGVSQWITGPAARRDVHALRARSCAMLTGIGTVFADDPRLTVREVETTRQPLRVVVDSALRISPTAKILHDGDTTVIYASASEDKVQAVRATGAQVLALPSLSGRVDLPMLIDALGKLGMNEVTVEAGSQLNGALLQAGLVDELVLYLAPVLLGDKALGLFNLPELTSMAGRRELTIVDQRMVGQDLRLTARFKGQPR